MRNRFDEQLSLLNRELIQMGALCEEVIALAAKALTTGDVPLAAKVAPVSYTHLDVYKRQSLSRASPSSSVALGQAMFSRKKVLPPSPYCPPFDTYSPVSRLTKSANSPASEVNFEQFSQRRYVASDGVSTISGISSRRNCETRFLFS